MRRTHGSGLHALCYGVAVIALVLGLTTIVAADVRPQERTTVYASWAYDVADDRYLVGASSNVFFATILSVEPGPLIVALDDEDPSVEDGPADVTPQTLYTVRAVGDIKGVISSLAYAPNVFQVLQAGGYDDTGELVLFEGDTLMSVGSTHLLVTRRYQPWPDVERPGMSSTEFCTVCAADLALYHLIAPGFDHKPAGTPEQRAALATQYQDAYANEIDPVPLIED